ncbi:MAG: DNA translocase FtsK 4TM domain-containing protein [Chloroflexota bacterium]|nr:DNA translocase FtsK 4TM domain-containing protein [Chloroflexota bacterium]
MSRYNDYDDDDELDDELTDDELEDDEIEDDDDPAPRSSANPFGSGQPRPGTPGTGSLQPRPSGVIGGGSGLPGSGPRPGGSTLPGSPPAGGGLMGGGSAPRPGGSNLPGSPPSTLMGGGQRPPGSSLPGSPPSGGGFGGSNLPQRPPPGSGLPGSPPSGGGLGGSNPPQRPPGSGLPGSPPAGGGSLGGASSLPGSKPPSQPLPAMRPGGDAPKPADPPKASDKPGDKSGDKPSGGSPLGGLGKGLGGLGGFGKKDDDKKDAPKSDKPAGGSPLGGLSKGLGGLGGFGKKDDDKKDAPKSDKPAGGNPLGGLAGKLPFGGPKDAKPASPPPPAGGGGLGGFGARPAGGSAPSAPAPSGGGPLGGSKPMFGGGAASAPAAPAGGAKPAAPKSAKAEGGLFKNLKIALPFGGKKSDKPARAKTSKAPKVDQGGLSLDTKLDIVGVALTVVALALLLASLSPNQGAITGEVNRFLSYLFGWGALAVPVIMLGAGIWLILRHFGDEAPTIETQRLIGLTVLFVSILTIMQFVEAFGYPQNASALIPQFLEASRSNGRGGGLIGGEIYLFLLNNFTEIGGFALMLIPLIVGLMLALSLSAAEIALIVVSNVRNIRDGARQRAIRAAAERVKKQEERALALQQAQAQALLNAPQPTAAALPQPAAQKPALPAPAESPVPLPLPLNTPEPRTIPIMAGGRTVNASVGNEAAAPPPAAQPAGAQYSAPPPAAAAPSVTPAAQTPGPRSTQERTGLGRLLPTASAAGAIGAAVKALTPTEETDAPPAVPGEKRGGAFGGLAGRLPFGNKPAAPTPTPNSPSEPAIGRPSGHGEAPAASVGAERVLPAVAPSAPPAVAANVPPPAIAPAPSPASIMSSAPKPAASLSGNPVEAERVLPPAPALTPNLSPERRGEPPADERPARFGDLLKPQPGGVTGQPPAASAATGMATDRPSGLQPRPFAPTTPPPKPAAPPVGTERVLPSESVTPKPAEPDDDDDWKSLPRAEPKGSIPLPPRPADSPFAPRVMQPRTDTPAASVGAPTPVTPSPAAPAASTSSSSSPLSTWQERMDAIRGKLPGDADKPAASLTGTTPAKDDPASTRAASILGPDRTPPRIIKMDDTGEDIDDDDEDLIDDGQPAMKPVTSAPAPTPQRTPITASPAFNKPDLPAAMMANPRLSPPAPSAGPERAVPLVAPPPPAAVVPPAASVGTERALPTAAPPPPVAAPPAPEPAPVAPVRSGRKEWRKPDPATLLKTGTDQELDHAMLLQRAKTIEETLNSFGAPGRVVEVRTGPVITQFGVEPDYLTVRGGKKTRVKVSAIAQLDKDLQLSLGAKAIRIEAPVPGKGYVGIEVPNDQASVVQLRDVMESEQFKKAKILGIALGQGVDGTPVAADLTSMPHLLIAGTTGSGKSVCVNSIIASLLITNSPEQLKFIMVDPKRVELTAYNGIPHLVAPVVVELERIVSVLKWVTREMDERYRKFSSAGARNIEDFNKHLPAGETRMPYIVVIIDELADLMMLAPEETERVITRLAALARATGIHLVIATQRPSVDVVTGLIKANFPARIAFAVAGSVDSRVILDQPGAERLLGRGDMLYMSGDSPAPQRLQGVYVSDSEINNITRYWRQQMDDADLANQGRPILTDFKLDEMGAKEAGDRRGTSGAAGIGMGSNQPRQQQLWSDGPSSYVSSRSANEDDMVDEDGDGEDDMYDQAVALVRQLRKASVSLLQRRLRIGYTRAAKLIDVMEERGVVGPAQSGSTPRDVIG